MNRVVGRSVCTLLRDAALGRNLPDNLKSWPLSPEKCWKYINWIYQPDFAILIFRTSADHSCVLPQLFSCHLSQKWSNAPPQQREGRNSQCRAGGEWFHWYIGRIQSICIYKQVYSEKITRIVEDISGLNLLEVNIFSSSKAHFHSHCNTTRWQIWTVCWSRSWTFPTPRSWWPGLRLLHLRQLLLLRCHNCLFWQNFFCNAFHPVIQCWS